MNLFNIFNKKEAVAAEPIKIKSDASKPVVLVIIDGYGLAPDSKGNAITLAKTPNMDSYMKDFPSGSLIASGESVGLPANEVGNTEVGHLTIGSGRVVLQDLKRISESIKDKSFHLNEALVNAADHTRKNNSVMHLIGIVSTGNVHSSLDHFNGLLDFCVQQNLKRVYLHLFTDGRDAPPRQAIKLFVEINQKIKDVKIAQIATLSGRYYAMDRDRRWERTQLAYKAIVEGEGVKEVDAMNAINNAYKRDKSDEFIEPVVMIQKDGTPVATINDNDAAIFFNFRIDRPKQLTMAFMLEDFENLKSFDFGHIPGEGHLEGEVDAGKTFKRTKIVKNLFFVTMTEYHKNIPVSGVAFRNEPLAKSLPEVLAANNIKQAYLSESEKERFITHYMNGMQENMPENADVLIIPSPKVDKYDKKPEMSARKLLSEFEKILGMSKYKFFAINFANPDMVAHTGNLKATIKAVEVVDEIVGELVRQVLSHDGKIIITADHGNAEDLLTYPSIGFYYTSEKGKTNTDHSNNPVPLIIIGNDLKGQVKKISGGSLSDIAPTILALMGIEKPNEMTGQNLMK